MRSKREIINQKTMATKKSNSQNTKTLLMVGLVVLIALAFIIFSAQQMTKGPGTTESRASTDSTLTVGNDVLSLEQDLDTLGTDKTAEEEVHLNSVE